MADNRLFVERQDDGRYAVKRANAERASAVCDTQAEAIARARELNPGEPPHVERVRDTGHGRPGEWRKA
jgi:hypothetical protein